MIYSFDLYGPAPLFLAAAILLLMMLVCKVGKYKICSRFTYGEGEKRRFNWVVGGLFGFWILTTCIAPFYYARLKDFEKEGVAASATVIEKYAISHLNGGSMYFIRYRYTGANQQNYIGKDSLEYSKWNRIGLQQTIDILYLKDQPSTSMDADWDNQNESMRMQLFMIGIFGLIVFMMITRSLLGLEWWFHKKRKRKS